MTPPPLPRWRVVVCTDCGSQLFRLRFRSEPASREVRRQTSAAFEQAQLVHWKACDGVVFVAVDVVGEPLTWRPLDPLGMPAAVDVPQPPGSQPIGDIRMSEEQDRHLEITPAALQVISAMQQRVAAIGDEYGQESSEHVEALKSLLDALVRVLRLGGRITKEDELSLFGASFIAYGVIFFPRRTHGVPDPLLGEWSVHS
jgi:hypothetical protein